MFTLVRQAHLVPCLGRLAPAGGCTPWRRYLRLSWPAAQRPEMRPMANCPLSLGHAFHDRDVKGLASARIALHPLAAALHITFGIISCRLHPAASARRHTPPYHPCRRPSGFALSDSSEPFALTHLIGTSCLSEYMPFPHNLSGSFWSAIDTQFWCGHACN